MTLEQVIKVVRPNFFIDRNASKPYQTDDILEDSKSAAVIMIVGISNIYNIPKKEVMEELMIDYDEYRHKLNTFQIQCSEVNRVGSDKVTGRLKRFYWKLKLIENALFIQFNNQAITMKEALYER